MGFLTDRKHMYLAKELESELAKVEVALAQATPAVRSATYQAIIAKINKLQTELDNLTSDGKFSLGGVLTKRGIDSLKFNISDGASTWVIGASLVAANMTESLEQGIVLSSSRRIINEAIGHARAAASGDSINDQVSGLLKLAGLCLAACLCMKFKVTESDLSAFSPRISGLTGAERDNVYCVAFGLVAGLAALRDMGRNEQLNLAALFLHENLGVSEAQSLRLVSRFAELRRGDPGFYVVSRARDSVQNYAQNQDLTVVGQLGLMI